MQNLVSQKLVRVALLVVHACVGSVAADDVFPARDLIGSKIESDEFKKVVQNICNPETKIVPDRMLKRSNIYLRLTNRQYAMKDGVLNPKATLGGKPYVFMTVPEAGFGRSIYGIYSDLGYDAEGILKQRGVEMVALVFRYKEDDVKFSPERKGEGVLLDQESYNRFVYVPTWKNAFSLLARLAEGNPAPLTFDSEAERNLARFFPRERRAHIAQLPYAILRAAGGPDWDYRQLLERKLGMNSHFRGVGITENTLSPGDNRTGVPEFVGPNRSFDQLQEFAVIDIGKMEFREVHETK